MSRRHLLANLRDPEVSSIGRVSGLREFRRHFYYFGNPNTMYVYDEFSTVPQRARGVKRERFRRNRVVERITAKEMLYDSTGWRFVNGSVRSFSDAGATLTPFDTLSDSILTVKPVDMVAKIKGKEEMSYWELRGFIEAAKKRGEKVQKYMGELDFKLALPFVNFIVVLLGIAITARSGRKGGAVFFGIGLGLVLAFLIMARLAIVFAQNGYIPTLVGAWIANVFFLLLGLVLYKRAIW
jgi:lipopolysaccharide export system permease protein